MKFLYAADIHLSKQHLQRFFYAAIKLDVDCLVIGGDLIPADIRDRFREIKDCIIPQGEWVTEIFLPAVTSFSKRFPEKKVLFDFGNDDMLANRRFLEVDDGVHHHLIHNRIIELAPGLALVGYMNIPFTPFMLKDWELPDREDLLGRGKNLRKKGINTGYGKARESKLQKITRTIEGDLAQLSEELNRSRWIQHKFIFVCHCPPADTALDLMHGNVHVGSESVRSFIDRWAKDGRLLTSLHGHIHEAPELSGAVFEFLGKVPCFNMGQNEETLQALLFEVDNDVNSAEQVWVDAHSLNRKSITIQGK